MGLQAMKTCQIAGCERRHYGHGYCHMHYQRARKGNDPAIDPVPRTTPCSIAGCERKHKARGLCGTHYYRSRHGLSLDEAVRPGFWDRVDCSAGPDGCWEWQGARGPHGYGRIGGGASYENERAAHRYALRSTGVDITEKVVMHLCDNPPCCNPRHLMAGTQEENMRQAVERDRFRTGERHPDAKLTWSKVREIRRLYSSGIYQRALAEKFGVSRQHISMIVLNKSWREDGDQ